MQNLFILASILATCNFFRDMQHGICWVLDPNTWLSPATSATVSYLKWAYNPPPSVPTLAPPHGSCKSNAVLNLRRFKIEHDHISSPFRMSKLNLPVRYWKPIFHNRWDRALKPTPNGSKGGSRQHGGTRRHSALGQLVNCNRRLVVCRLNMFEAASIIIM